MTTRRPRSGDTLFAATGLAVVIRRRGACVLTSSVRGAAVARLRARSLRRDDSGAAAVEFALVASLLIILVFGIIEFSLVMRDSISITSSVRTAARIASAGAGSGPATCIPGPTPCTPGIAPKLAQDAADAIQRSGTAMPKDSIDELWIYKAPTNGLPPATCSTATNCVKYRWVDSNNRFTYVQGGWASTSIAACAGGGSDSVGVYMKATHKFLLPLFGSTIALSDRAVMQFEPLSVDTCQANKPIGGGGHP
jgi:Flp pilus assembly pilin Flp